MVPSVGACAMTYDDVSHAKGRRIYQQEVHRKAKQQKLENVGCNTGTFRKG